jgi:hypothetical protein
MTKWRIITAESCGLKGIQLPKKIEADIKNIFTDTMFFILSNILVSALMLNLYHCWPKSYIATTTTNSYIATINSYIATTTTNSWRRAFARNVEFLLIF